MITTKLYGRAGNNLFQICAAIGFAKKFGEQWHIPKDTMNNIDFPPHFTWLENHDWNPNLTKEVVKEQGHEYNYIPFRGSYRRKNIELDGYWQSELYFKDYWEEIRPLFRMNWEMKPGFVSVHVRRGDYVKFADKHPPVTKEYVENALQYIGGNYEPLFFSDDIQWCMDTFRYGSFVENGDTIGDMELMSSCEHNIIANSSYSWFGAYFNQNPNKIVIGPKVWFGPGNSQLNTSTIIPENWIKL